MLSSKIEQNSIRPVTSTLYEESICFYFENKTICIQCKSNGIGFLKRILLVECNTCIKLYFDIDTSYASVLEQLTNSSCNVLEFYTFCIHIYTWGFSGRVSFNRYDPETHLCSYRLTILLTCRKKQQTTELGLQGKKPKEPNMQR